jgi:hypothetical protein
MFGRETRKQCGILPKKKGSALLYKRQTTTSTLYIGIVQPDFHLEGGQAGRKRCMISIKEG